MKWLDLLLMKKLNLERVTGRNEWYRASCKCRDKNTGNQTIEIFLRRSCTNHGPMTAKDLLYKYIEYACDWSTEKEFPSSSFRLRQIEAMLEAFELTKKYADPHRDVTYFDSNGGQQTRAEYLDELTDLEYFEQCEFIDERPEEVYKELIDHVIKIEVEPRKSLKSIRDKRIDPGTIFGALLSFRLDIYRLIHNHGYQLEGYNVAFAYAMRLRWNLIDTLNKNLDEIDEILWLLIDPQKRDIPLETLVSRFNYPDVDLGEHDRQYRFDTF